MEISGGNRLAQLNLWEVGGQISATGTVQRRLLLLKKPPRVFLFVCWEFLSWSFLVFSVSWDEALVVLLCPLPLPSSATPAQGTASQGLLLLACGHCWSTLPKPEFFTWVSFYNFPFDRLLFYSAAVKVKGIKMKAGSAGKSCTMSCAPVPEVSFWGRSVIRHETGNTSSHLMGFSLVEEQRY